MQLTLTPSEFSSTFLSLNSQQSCEDPFSAPELESTLKKMENNKSPGIDGPTSNFYKHFWPILGPEITQVFNHCRHSLLTRTQCWGIITLILKKEIALNFKIGDRLLSLPLITRFLPKHSLLTPQLYCRQ